MIGCKKKFNLITIYSFSLQLSTETWTKDVYELVDYDSDKLISSVINIKTTSFIYNNMAYVYSVEQKIVYGVSLRDLNYKGRDVKKFLSVLYRKTRVISLKDDISFEIRSAFFGNTYVIPCLYY